MNTDKIAAALNLLQSVIKSGERWTPACDVAVDEANAQLTIVSLTPELAASEWDSLWSWHHDQELTAANRQHYADAEYHKNKAVAIWPLTALGRRKKAPIT